jgi:hypothetical protein
VSLVPLETLDDGARLIGWTVSGMTVAKATVRRLGPDEIVIESVEVAPGAPAGVDRDVLEALADVATARHIRTADGSWSRDLSVEPDPDANAFTLSQLEDAIRSSWSGETSEDPDDWTPENPALGQCGVTALLVRELLGGEILVAHVVLDGRRTERHAWNRLPSGLTLDLSREQFRDGQQLTTPRVEEPVVTQQRPERYALLRERVRAKLGV